MTTSTANIKVMIETTLAIKPLKKMMPESVADDRRVKQLYSLLDKKFPGLSKKCSSVRIVSCK